MKKPKVSIVIRTKNEEKWLKEVLRKLSQQTFQDYETIIVDSGSIDNTLEIIKEFPVKLIKIKPEEFNYSFALNLGISQSRGEFIVIISGHSIPISNHWLANGLSHFINPKIAGVTGYGYGENNFLGNLTGGYYLEKIKQVLKIKDDFFFSNTNSLLRKSLWKKYPFDESLPECEDYDWASEMKARDFKIIIDHQFDVFHLHPLTVSGWFKRQKKWSLIIQSQILPKKRPGQSFSKIIRKRSGFRN